MFKLREYQEQCHNETMSYLSSKAGLKPGIIVMPTGLGKSLSIAKVVQDYPENSVIICPSQEILKQNYAKFIAFGGSASIYSASLKTKVISNVTFATLGSIKALGNTFKKNGVSLLCLDECHLNTDPSKGMFKDFLGDLNPKHVLGYTATPFRLKAYQDNSGYSYSQLTLLNRSRPKFFSNIVHATQIPYAVKNGFWAPIELYNETFNPLGLVLNSSGAEYTETSIEQAVVSNNINNNIYRTVKALLREDVNSILIFLDKVSSCYTMANALGPLAAVIEAKTPSKDRELLLAKFQSGEIKIICCVSTLTTGFDFPELQVVMMGRPTNSLAVFYQIYGRLVRPFEGKIGKFYDYGGNIDRFGRMEDMEFLDYPNHGWAFFSGENLLTGTPMGGDKTTKSELNSMGKIDCKPGTSKVFEFGQYRGAELKSIPTHYLVWALKNARNNMTKPLINECQKIMTTV